MIFKVYKIYIKNMGIEFDCFLVCLDRMVMNIDFGVKIIRSEF